MAASFLKFEGIVSFIFIIFSEIKLQEFLEFEQSKISLIREVIKTQNLRVKILGEKLGEDYWRLED